MEKKDITLKEVFNVLWNEKLLTVLCATILGVIVLVGGIVYENSVTTVSTVVALEWNGLTDGEYPDGSQFDYHDMFESYVINKASDGVNVSAEDIRENLTISPILENDVLAIVENALENGEKIAYYASEYAIKIDVGKAGMTVSQGKTFLSTLLSEYRVDFEKKYVQSASVLDFTNSLYDELDYLEIQEVFRSQLDVIRTKMTKQITLAGNYGGGDSGFSFNDILVREELVRKIQYSNLSAKIADNVLTKDLNELLSKLLFQKEAKEYDLAISSARRDMITSLITNYKGNTSTVIIPGTGTENEIVIDTYYKELVDQQIAAEVEVVTLEQDIETISTTILRYKGLDPEYIIDEEEQIIAKDNVDGKILLLDEQLSSLVEDTNAVLLEYNAYLISGQITPLMAPQEINNVSLITFTAMGIVLGAGIGMLITLFKHDWE
jgi:hypothetical protein